jgi:hypothetical protein
MTRWLLIIILALRLTPVIAAWEFEEKLSVSPHHGEKIFHHLDSAGRKNIAVAGNTVAVVWEDNHTGASQVYISMKADGASSFGMPQLVSTGKSAYGPVIASRKNKQFLIAWEQDEAIWMRSVGVDGLGKSLRVSPGPGQQPTLIELNSHEAVIAWATQHGRHTQILIAIAQLGRNGTPLKIGKAFPLDTTPLEADQLYPSLTKTERGVTVIWEDRRGGHTKLLYSHARAGAWFTAPQGLNEVVQKSTKYGRGSGVTRAAAASFGKNNIAVTWMDKRGFRTGYDVYAAVSNDSGKSFNPNEQVQDSFGDNITQWNPAIAGNPHGDVAVAWDDDRDETSDIWLSWRTVDGWSEDVAIDCAAGKSHQVSPALALDEQRNLHVVWIEKQTEFGITRLHYCRAKYVEE